MDCEQGRRDLLKRALGIGVDAQKMINRLNQSTGTKVDVPQGGVVWVFAVK